MNFTINITILDDIFFEESESFLVKMNFKNDTIDTTQVFIKDNDGEHCNIYFKS